MSIVNKIFAIIFTFIYIFTSFFGAFADTTNKDALLSDISTLETNLNNLKTNRVKELETKVSDLTTKYDQMFTSLWYDAKVVSYLVSLWKVTSNFKADLVADLSTLKNEINTKANTELSSLSTIKDNVNYKYTTISNSEKTVISASINAVKTNYESLDSTIASKITQLNSKYSTNLDSYKSTLKSAFDSNQSSITTIKAFDSKYEVLYWLKTEFDAKYEIFKKIYLSSSWDLKDYSTTKQQDYVNSLKKELEKLRDWNFEANKGLKNYESDINRFIEILLENFKNSLSLSMTDSYWAIFSDDDVTSLQTRFSTLKNKLYDTDWNIKATVLLSDSWATDEVNYLTTSYTTINTSIKDLIWTDTTSTITLNNIKVRLENQIVKFYNANYESYRQDLLEKLQEKLNLAALETKNILLASDTVDLKFSMLNDKISKSNDLTYINEQISTFKKDVEKYTLLWSDTLTKKVKKLWYNLDVFVIWKQLSNSKYSKYTSLSTTYDTQVKAILVKLKSAYPDAYVKKLETIVSKIDAISTQKISTKNSFILLTIKKSILNWLSSDVG